MLKTDLHLHTKEDPLDGIRINYSAKELIDYAAELSFDVISITNHNRVSYSNELKDYAEKKGILLIPGAEIKINGKEVLVYNIFQEDIEKIKTFDDLRKIKNDNNLIIAPHPYFMLPQCLKKDLDRNIDLFDAIEYSYFYINLLNRNKKAVKTAKKYKKPLIGNSDAHFLWQMNRNYSLVDSKKDTVSVINSIKNNKIKLVARPLSFARFMKIFLVILFFKFKKFMQKKTYFPKNL